MPAGPVFRYGTGGFVKDMGDGMEIFKVSNKVREKSMMALSVCNVGRQQCTPGYKWGPGVRDHFLIHYITGGKGTYTVGDRERPLSAGDVFIVFPGMEISYQADQEDPWSYEWVGFNGSDARALLNASDFAPDRLVMEKIAYGDRLHSSLCAVYDSYGSEFYNTVAMTGHLYGLLALLAEKAEFVDPLRDRDAEIVRRAIAFIDSRYSYTISIEDVAHFVGVSRSTLFRMFIRYLEISPKEYLERYRIRKASALLRTTDLTVGSIATSVGYDNGLYFSKAFRRMTGQSPTECRMEARETGREDEAQEHGNNCVRKK
ncbi:MAG: AraC family transcriptional regulator [Eubacteriales bacterium]